MGESSRPGVDRGQVLRESDLELLQGVSWNSWSSG
jgi:hypothetical protein